MISPTTDSQLSHLVDQLSLHSMQLLLGNSLAPLTRLNDWAVKSQAKIKLQRNLKLVKLKV